MKLKLITVFIVSMTTSLVLPLKIDRVILTSNDNPMYLDFWPLVAKAWKQIIGIQPTLFLISDHYIEVDETVGDVIRIQSIPGVKTSTHAQILRLVAPIYFENEVSIISDIDMLPLNRDYFIKSVADISDEKFVVYRDKGYGENSNRFPMCYSAGKGYLFKSIFNINGIDEIPNKIKQWIQEWHAKRPNEEWETDEVTMFKYLHAWKYLKSRCVFLHHTSMLPQRIDRSDWRYDKEKLKNNYYIDAHMVRPLQKYYREIKELADDLGLIL